jgi:putative peptidoglycan lipid II flippase
MPAQVTFRAVEALLPLALAYWFGRSDSTDVYYFAWAVFAVAGTVVFSAHQDSALVPIIAEERLARPEGLPRLLGSVLAHTWTIGGAIAIVVAGGALVWFRVRYDDAQFALAARMVVPFCFYLVAMSTRTFFGAVLVAERRFVVQPMASCAGVLLNVAILALGHAAWGVALVPVAALAGEIAASAILAWYTIRALGRRVTLCFERPPALLGLGRLVVSEVGGNVVTRVNPVVDQLMAGLSAVIGAGTMLRYSGDVATIPTSVLQTALLPVLLSHLSDDFARRDISGIRRTVVRALLSVCGLLLVAALLLYAVRGPLMRFVFLRGEMDIGGVERMIRILPYHLVGLAPFGALLVLARAHVAIKNGSIMVSMGIINAASNALFNVVLLRAIGLEGIALSTSSVSLVVAIVFWFRFETRLAVVRAERPDPDTVATGLGD